MFQQFFGYMDVEMSMLKCYCGEKVWFMPKSIEDIKNDVCKCGATFQQRYDHWRKDYTERYDAWQKEQREKQTDEAIVEEASDKGVIDGNADSGTC